MSFARLHEKDVLQTISTKANLPKDKLKIIAKEFTVAYEYTFTALIEQRSIINKTCPVSEPEKPCSINYNTDFHVWDYAIATPDTFEDTTKYKFLASDVFVCDSCHGTKNCICDACIKKCTKRSACHHQDQADVIIKKLHEKIFLNSIFGTHFMSKGVIKCPQCHGVGFGARILRFKKNYCIKSRKFEFFKNYFICLRSTENDIAKRSYANKNMLNRQMSSCSRCMGKNTIECTKCKSKSSKCSECHGHGKVKKEKHLKSVFLKVEDKVVVGKHTSKIPTDLFFKSYGINLHEGVNPLEEDVCPDRRDLVEASRKVVRDLTRNCNGKVRNTNHILRGIPLCTTVVECLKQPGNKIYYIIGSMDCKFWTNLTSH